MTLLQHVVSIGRYSAVGSQPSFDTVAATSAGWPLANRAIYVPIVVPDTFTVARFFSVNGSATGNDDVGLYNSAGVKQLSTGSSARTSACNYYDVADTSFVAGFYYLALAHDNTGQHLAVAQSLDVTRLEGVLMEAAAFPLPATMTPVTILTAYVPVFGFTQSGTI